MLPRYWPQCDIDTVLCLFGITVTQMQEYNQITAELDWNLVLCIQEFRRSHVSLAINNVQ